IPAGIALVISQLVVDQNDLSEAIRRMVAGLVSMVPEGLVLLTSLAFAAGVVRLGARNCLVQELPAIEGLARVSVVCLDKTGTLTEPAMDVLEVRALGADAGGTVNAGDDGAGPPAADGRVAAVLGALGAAEREPAGRHRRLPGAGRLAARRRGAVLVGAQVVGRDLRRAGRSQLDVAARRTGR